MHAKAELKPKFEAAGITECELRIPGTCWVNNGLTWAHAVKRRFLDKNAVEGHPTNIQTVILACVQCHNAIEKLPHEEMLNIVMRTIDSRKR